MKQIKNTLKFFSAPDVYKKLKEEYSKLFNIPFQDIKVGEIIPSVVNVMKQKDFEMGKDQKQHLKMVLKRLCFYDKGNIQLDVTSIAESYREGSDLSELENSKKITPLLVELIKSLESLSPKDAQVVSNNLNTINPEGSTSIFNVVRLPLNKVLEQHNDNLSQLVNKELQRGRDKEFKLKQLESAYRSQSQELTKVKKDASKLVLKVQSYTKDIHNLKLERNQSEEKLKMTNTILKVTEKKYDELEKELSVCKSEIERLNVELNVAQNREKKSQDKLAVLKKEVENYKLEYKKVRAENVEFRKELDSLENAQNHEAYKKQSEEIEAENLKLIQELESLQQQNKELLKEKNEFKKQLDSYEQNLKVLSDNLEQESMVKSALLQEDQKLDAETHNQSQEILGNNSVSDQN